MSHVAVIGCGVVGALIAYELSQVPGISVTVLDKQLPAQGATGAALGVLMGILSHKIKGRAWQMRQNSIQRYESLIPELELLTDRQIPFNRQGILMLLLNSLQKPQDVGEKTFDWAKLAAVRQDQGWQLEIWDKTQTVSTCPYLDGEAIAGAIFSPQDRQVDPTALTSALVAASMANGVKFKFDVALVAPEITQTHNVETNLGFCNQIQTTDGLLKADWFVISAGLGSNQIISSLNQSLDIRPVLGQALHLKLQNSVEDLGFQPVITGNDVHIVPVGRGECWVGATVEFPNNGVEIVAAPARLDEVMQQAIAFYPALAKATVMRTWSGLRPRPTGRPAPVIGLLPGYSNVLLATGHYRNGVLLAPATAEAIREIVTC